MVTTEKNTKEEKHSFDEMPAIIHQLSCDMKTVVEHITVINQELKRLKGDQKVWLTIEKLSEYIPTHPAKQTIYGWMNQRAIPYYKGEKTTLFLKSDIDEWMSVRHIVPKWWNERELFLLDAKNNGKEL